MFEDVRRGPLSDLVKEFEDRQVKGEVAVVIAGNNPKFTRDPGAVDGDGESTEGVGNR